MKNGAFLILHSSFFILHFKSFRHGRCPLRDVQQVVQSARQLAHDGRAEDGVRRVRQRQYRAQGAFDAGKVACGEVADFVAHALWRQELLADVVRQFARVDAHGAGRGAQAVAGTGLVAGIVVLLDEQGQAFGILAALAQAGNLALDDDALARG